MDIETLDAKLRAKGRKRLEEEIKTAFRQVETLVAKCSYGEYRFGDTSAVVSVGTLCSHLKRAILATSTERYEQEEVSAFLVNIETMRQDLDQAMADLDNG